MHVIRLIHWNIDEARERAGLLRAAGYRVSYELPRDFTFFRKLRADPPDAFVIDLSRLPSQGRDFALGIRQSWSTRRVPLLFVDGETEKVRRIKQHLPDAVFTSWSRIASALKKAIAFPPTDVAAPSSMLAGYSGTPLPKKLGIKANTLTCLVNPPAGFEEMLGEPLKGARIQRKQARHSDISIWFVTSRRELESLLDGLAAAADRLWIAWPKKASGVKTDVSEKVVRDAGIACGLVDYKICAIDRTWSGLLFTRKKPS